MTLLYFQLSLTSSGLLSLGPGSLGPLASSLSHLDLSSNLLNRVPGALSGLTKLRSLDLSHNSISHIESGLFQNMTR